MTDKWEYVVVPFGRRHPAQEEVPARAAQDLGSHGWEAVGLRLKRGDLVAWPVVLLKRRKPQP